MDTAAATAASHWEAATAASHWEARKPLPPPGIGEVDATRRLVRAALDEDAACRHPGVTKGLYGLEALAPFARLGHGVPVIRSSRSSGGAPFSRAATDEEFRRRLRRIAPYLANFDFQAHGLRFAGGAASALLMRDPEADDLASRSFHDFDLFLVGHTSDQAAKDAIYAFAEHMAKAFDRKTLEVYRTQNCISFYGGTVFEQRELRGGDAGDLPDPHMGAFAPSDDGPSEHHTNLVQIILRRYSTDGEVIHGFDMGSSAVLWDGRRVVVTGLGALAAERGVNVLNLVARRGSYERRLAKYFGRGFDLVLPDLDGCALESVAGRLPYLYVDGIQRRGCACDLVAGRLFATRPGFDVFGFRIPDPAEEADEASAVGSAEDHDAGRPASDYAWGDISYGNRHRLTMRNVLAVSGKEVRNASLCAWANYSDKAVPILEIEPAVTADDLFEIARWAFRGCRPGGSGEVGLGTLRRLLGPDRAAELVIEFMTRGKRPSDAVLAQCCAARAAELPAASIPFVFMRVEDKTALTGPFPREVVTKMDWYGAADRNYGTW